ELRAARRQEQLGKVEAARHSVEAAAPRRQGEHDQAKLHKHAASSWTAPGRLATLVREKLAVAHDTRCPRDLITGPTPPLPPRRRVAVAHEIDLGRAGVVAQDHHLRSVEDEGFKCQERDTPAVVWIDPRLSAFGELPRGGEQLSGDGREQRALGVLGLTLGYV